MKLVLFLVLLVILFVIIGFSYITLYNIYVYYCSKDPLSHFLQLHKLRPSLYLDLKQNWKQIRQEVLNAREKFSSIKGDLYFDESVIKTEKWKKVYLKWYSDPPNYANKLFPKTMELIRKHKCIHLAMFSLLEPGCKILPHRGPFRGCIRVHLCLSAPNSELCYIKVNNERYIWKEGSILAFDDTYLHSVENKSNEDRIVLFLDVERRMALRFINRLIITHIAKKTSRINDEIEKDYSMLI